MSAPDFDITLTGLAESEASWHGFEQGAVASPYQRFDWIWAYAEAHGLTRDVQVASVRRAGRLVAMTALRIDRAFGLRVARPVGGKHANFNMLPVDHEFVVGASPSEMRTLLIAIGRAVRADVVALPACPACWEDVVNPLAGGSAPSASNAYGLSLGPDPDEVLTRVSSSQARKKLRSKERGLAKLGDFAVKRAASPAEVDSVLGAFFEQKSRRFGTIGIEDPYAGSKAQAFVHAASLAGLDTGRPAVELYGLYLDGRVVAVLGGATDKHRFSGMFISFDIDAPEARFSPGEILVSHVIAAQCRAGRTRFDLGVGEARYKRIFCNDTIELVDIVVPVTAAGTAARAAMTLVLAAKRRLKQSPAFMGGLARLRRLKVGARGLQPGDQAACE